MDLMSAVQLAGYLPIGVKWIDARAQIDWCVVGDAKFTAPFFSETIQQCLRRPFNLAFRPQTNVDSLIAYAQSHDCLSPTGFIFHMSRCGSTLVSQMFAAVAQNLVLSEAPPIDRMLVAKRFNPNLSEQEHLAMVRAMVLSLGRRRRPELQRCIIKFDSWHVSHLGLIQRAFPHVPWVFLYRDPLEVLVSNLDQLSGATSPGAAEHIPPGVHPLDALTMPIEQYVSLVLAHICRAALSQQNNPLGLFVNYQDLPQVALPKILRHFAIQPDAGELLQMQQQTRFHAKQPRADFSPDSERKQREASAEARCFSDSILMPIYAQLESVAQSQAQSRLTDSN
jgi:Sulfotransferase family